MDANVQALCIQYITDEWRRLKPYQMRDEPAIPRRGVYGFECTSQSHQALQTPNILPIRSGSSIKMACENGTCGNIFVSRLSSWTARGLSEELNLAQQFGDELITSLGWLLLQISKEQTSFIWKRSGERCGEHCGEQAIKRELTTKVYWCWKSGFGFHDVVSTNRKRINE